MKKASDLGWSHEVWNLCVMRVSAQLSWLAEIYHEGLGLRKGFNKNKGRNGTNHGLFRKLYVCQESCIPPRQLHNVKTVVRKLWESCEKIVWKFSDSCEKAVRKLWKGCEKVVRKMWESGEKDVRKLWESCEKHVRNLWESCEKVMRKLWERCEKVVRKLWESCEKVVR